MRQYQRLMRRRGQTTHSNNEQADLLRVLVAAPGAENAEVVEIHPKGGYRVRFDLSPKSLDEFIAYIEEHDWMSVI